MSTPIYIQKMFIEVYNQIYSNVLEKTIHCFLCGAKKGSSTQNISMREKIRIALEDKYKIKTIYAEDLFKNMVDINNDYDFLYLENLLAENADVVIIVLESEGAFVELGAFSNSDNLRDKLIVLMDNKYKGHESFINLGPVKILKKIRKKSIIYYRDGEASKDVTEDTYKSIEEYLKDKDFKHKYNELITIISIYHFLQIYLYFFSPVKFDEIYLCIQPISKDEPNNLKVKIRAAMNFLFKEGLVKRQNDFYVITEKGYYSMNKFVLVHRRYFTDKYIFDKLRIAVLNRKLRHQYKNYEKYFA